MAQLRHEILRAEVNGYSDVYSDVYEGMRHLHIVARKHEKWYKGDTLPVSSLFEADAELEEHPDIWAAVATVWDDRGSYATIEDLIADMDAALSAAGYTAPGGVPL